MVRKPAPRDDTPAVFIPPSIATTAALNLLQVPAVGVVADFLSMVRKTAVESLERSYDERWVREARIEYVLTIPAMWSDAAKDTMCRAAEMAGFGRHREKFWLVSEPEAAAGGFSLRGYLGEC